MAILTVRLTEEEERLLERRSRRAGMKKASFVRKLIREQPLETAADVLADAARRGVDDSDRLGIGVENDRFVRICGEGSRAEEKERQGQTSLHDRKVSFFRLFAEV